MKKLLAVITAVMLIAGCFAGCGGKGGDSGKDVTLKWVMGHAEPKDKAEVLEKANEMLETLLPNTSIELIFDTSMSSKWSLWIAGGKTFDIAHAGFDTDIATEINNGSYIPLNDLIDEYAPTIKELRDGVFKDLFGYGTYMDELYAIPCIQTYCKETLCFSIPTDLRQYLDVDALVKTAYASSTTTEEFYEIVDNYLNSAKKAGAINTEKISGVINTELMYNFAKRGYEFIGGEDSSLAYKLDTEKAEIVDFHTTDEFKTYIKWLAKWNSEGFVSKDVLTGGTPGSKMYLIESHIRERNGEEADNTITMYTNDYQQYRTSVFMTNPEYDYRGYNFLGKLQTFLAIPSTSSSPERAIKFLDLIYSEKGKDLINLLTFGIEGKHYEKVSDNAIKAFDYEAQPAGSVSYGIAAWRMGNMFNMYAVYPYTEETIAYAKDYWENKNPNRPKAATYGMSFDVNEIKKKLADTITVNQEYELQLTAGIYPEYDSFYNEMNSLNEKAGMSDMIKALQKQVDDYIASK